MKWSLFFKEKMKAASILAALMLAIIFSNIIERVIDNTNDETVSSVIKDRLTPSVDLFEMRNLNEQRISIINQSRSDVDFTNGLKQELTHINQEFDLLLKKYKNTYLVNEEKVILTALHRDLISVKQIISPNKISSVNEKENALLSLAAINLNLNKLNKVQEKVGKELMSAYEEKTFLSSFLNAFQILIAIVIGIIILQMVAQARMLNLFDQKQKPIHLN